MGMVAHHHVSAQLQELQVTVTGVGAGEAGELLTAVGHDDAPAALGLDLLDALFDVLQVIPAEDAGLGLGGGDALVHVGNIEHADAACLVQVHRLGGLMDVHTGTDGLDTQVSGDLPGGGDTFAACVHGVVVADGPDIGFHIHEDLGCFGVHGMEEHTPGAVVHGIDQSALNVGADMVGGVEEVQNILAQQVLILPLSVHIAVETDIAGKYNGSYVFFHNLCTPFCIIFL